MPVIFHNSFYPLIAPMILFIVISFMDLKVALVLLICVPLIPMRQLGSYFHIAMNGMAASDKLFAILEKEIEEKQNVKIRFIFNFCSQSTLWIYR